MADATMHLIWSMSMSLQDGRTALHLAAEWGNIAAVRVLLAASI